MPTDTTITLRFSPIEDQDPVQTIHNACDRAGLDDDEARDLWDEITDWYEQLVTPHYVDAGHALGYEVLFADFTPYMDEETLEAWQAVHDALASVDFDAIADQAVATALGRGTTEPTHFQVTASDVACGRTMRQSGAGITEGWDLGTSTTNPAKVTCEACRTAKR